MSASICLTTFLQAISKTSCAVSSTVLPILSAKLIEDGRVAWLFRFATTGNVEETAALLTEAATVILKQKGHSQVLVYSPAKNSNFDKRYEDLGFTKGSDYTCYWKDIV